MSEAVAEKPVSETRVRVRYAETDQMGVVYHANYLVWFEVGRVEFIRQLEQGTGRLLTARKGGRPRKRQAEPGQGRLVFAGE